MRNGAYHRQEIRWLAGPKIRGTKRIHSHVLVLSRNSRVQSHSDQVFFSAHCQNCGAPVDVNQVVMCGYCSTSLNDGSQDWVLEQVKLWGPVNVWNVEDPGKERIADRSIVTRSETDGLGQIPELLTALSILLTSDGELHDRERNFVSKLATRQSISPKQLKLILASAQVGDSHIRLPTRWAGPKRT